MYVTLLGTGGPRPDPDRAGPATLIDASGRLLLVDAGRGVCLRLAQAGIGLDELDAVLLTHHHFDHIGDLGDVLLASWNLGRTDPLPVIGPRGTAVITEALISTVYRADIAFRLREDELLGGSLRPIEDMIAVSEVGHGWSGMVGDVQIAAAAVDHGEVLGLPDWSALGFRFEGGGKTAAVSGDAIPSPGLVEMARDVDLLVMCSYLAPSEVTEPDLEFLTESILGGVEQAVEVANDAGAKRLVLTHLREKPGVMLVAMQDYADGRFTGDVIVGHDLMTIGA
ncbi:MAG: MBL fold metallo-hydrolase [Actinomycetota bacterium]|nr:MBL fold metallo-hydrolase [Actinomycetota bacterium]